MKSPRPWSRSTTASAAFLSRRLSSRCARRYSLARRATTKETLRALSTYSSARTESQFKVTHQSKPSWCSWTWTTSSTTARQPKRKRMAGSLRSQCRDSPKKFSSCPGCHQLLIRATSIVTSCSMSTSSMTCLAVRALSIQISRSRWLWFRWWTCRLWALLSPSILTRSSLATSSFICRRLIIEQRAGQHGQQVKKSILQW